MVAQRLADLAVVPSGISQTTGISRINTMDPALRLMVKQGPDGIPLSAGVRAGMRC